MPRDGLRIPTGERRVTEGGGKEGEKTGFRRRDAPPTRGGAGHATGAGGTEGGGRGRRTESEDEDKGEEI